MPEVPPLGLNIDKCIRNLCLFISSQSSHLSTELAHQPTFCSSSSIQSRLNWSKMPCDFTCSTIWFTKRRDLKSSFAGGSAAILKSRGKNIPSYLACLALVPVSYKTHCPSEIERKLYSCLPNRRTLFVQELLVEMHMEPLWIVMFIRLPSAGFCEPSAFSRSEQRPFKDRRLLARYKSTFTAFTHQFWPHWRLAFGSDTSTIEG